MFQLCENVGEDRHVLIGTFIRYCDLRRQLGNDNLGHIVLAVALSCVRVMVSSFNIFDCFLQTYEGLLVCFQAVTQMHAYEFLILPVYVVIHIFNN